MHPILSSVLLVTISSFTVRIFVPNHSASLSHHSQSSDFVHFLAHSLVYLHNHQQVPASRHVWDALTVVQFDLAWCSDIR